MVHIVRGLVRGGKLGRHRTTSSVNAYVINGGTAAITLPGAACYDLYLGDPNSTNSGTIQMSGGSLTVSYYEYVGNDGAGTFNQTGGTNNVSSSSGGLYLGYTSASYGSYNLSAGQLLGNLQYLGYSGTGRFTQSGGTNTFSNLYLGYYSRRDRRLQPHGRVAVRIRRVRGLLGNGHV